MERDDDIDASLINDRMAELTRSEREPVGMHHTPGNFSLNRLARLKKVILRFAAHINRRAPRFPNPVYAWMR
jgi:hypothetical protein